MWHRYQQLVMVVLCWSLGTDSVCQAAPLQNVEIVVAPDAVVREREAAQFLAGTLGRLFEQTVPVKTEWTPGTAPTILVGHPNSHPAIKTLVGDQWPSLTDQGFVLKSLQYEQQPVLIVGGGSPTATYWAAAEVLHQFGVRSLLFADVLPAETPEFSWQNWDKTAEPRFTRRGWRAYDAHVQGFESWPISQQVKLLEQLAKLRFNHVVLPLEVWQPEPEWSAHKVPKTLGVFGRGEQFSVEGDVPGRAAFRGATLFQNRDFEAAESYRERTAACQKMITRLIEKAHQAGMTVSLELSPFSVTPEFQTVLPQFVPGALPQLSLVPGPQQSATDPRLLALIKARLEAYSTAFPEVDELSLVVPAAALGTWDPASALELLVTHLDQTPLKDWPAWKARTLATDSQELAEKFPTLPATLAPSASLREIAKSTTFGPAKGLLLQTPLTEPAAGPLPQLSLTMCGKVLAAWGQAGGAGYVATCTQTGDVNPSVYYLSRVAYQPALAPEAALIELIDAVSGPGASPNARLGLNFLEQATDQIVANAPQFFALEKDLLKPIITSSEPVPAWWATVKNCYLQSMNEMYRANTRAREGTRTFTLYYAKRSEFGFTLLAGLEAIGRARLAEKGSEDRVAALEQAVEAFYGALVAYSEVSRDLSDQGHIAATIEFAYRPLVARLEAAYDEAE